jgi:signal transduction histidine kinase
MENFVEPYVQELGVSSALSQEAVQRLGALLTETPLGQQVVSFKVWTRGGTVIASSRADLVGKQFKPSPGLNLAWDGVASASFNPLDEIENEFERKTGLSLLEVYIPLRVRGSDLIVAVGEFYNRGDQLHHDLNGSRLRSWFVVAGITAKMLSALYAIVRRGSFTIEFQRAALEQRIAELTRLLEENRDLRHRVESTAARASANSEAYLRRLGADLHDGPAQLISLALLRINEPAAQYAGSVPYKSLRASDVLTQALNQIRTLSAGYSVPEIENLSLPKTLETAVRRHELLTTTMVEFQCELLPPIDDMATKLAAYRLVQEGLSNAFRHAGGVGQQVRVRNIGDTVEICILDGGNQSRGAPVYGLGLRGLKDRLECLGGTLIMQFNASGATLTGILPVQENGGILA